MRKEMIPIIIILMFINVIFGCAKSKSPSAPAVTPTPVNIIYNTFVLVPGGTFPQTDTISGYSFNHTISSFYIVI